MINKDHRLGDLVEVTAGQAAPQDDQAFAETGYPFIRAGSLEALTTGGCEEDCEKIEPAAAKRYHLRLFPQDTIIFAKSGMSAALERVYRLKGPCYLVTHLAALVPTDRVEPSFLERWLATHPPARLIKDKSYPSIRTSEIAEMPIRVPENRAEQRRIAIVLERSDAIRHKRRMAVRLADELLRSAYLDLFGDPVKNPKGWPQSTLGQECRFFAGNSLPEGEAFVGQEGGFLHLKVGDMNLAGNEEIIQTAREWSSSALKAITAPIGSIVIPKRGGAISTNKKRILGRDAALDPNLMAIAAGPNLNLHFLYWWFQLFDLAEITSGSTVPQLNKGDLAPLVIPIPGKAALRRFDALIAKQRTVKRYFETQLSQGDILFRSLLQRAFGCEVTNKENRELAHGGVNR